MVPKTLETTLSQIRSNHVEVRPLTDLGEEAIKQAVILPLLNRVGWDNEDVAVVSPEYETGHGLVDYALRVDGVSRVYVEAKAGSVELSEHEEQVQRYCVGERPDLAVLTNGQEWWLYVLTKKNGRMGRFLEFDIIASDYDVQSYFTKFLANESTPLRKDVLAEARRTYRDRLNKGKAFRRMMEAWDELSNESPHLVALLKSITPSPPDDDVVKEFLESLDQPLVNRIAEVKQTRKPASFTFRANKRRVAYPVNGKYKGWNNLLLSICELLGKLHPNSFHESILLVPGWFSDTETATFKTPVGDSGLYVKREGSSREVRKVCYEIVQNFGYPRDSLVIKDKNDNVL